MFATLPFQDIFQQIQHSFIFLQMLTTLHTFLPFSHFKKTWSIKSMAKFPITSVTLEVKLSAYET